MRNGPMRLLAELLDDPFHIPPLDILFYTLQKCIKSILLSYRYNLWYIYLKSEMVQQQSNTSKLLTLVTAFVDPFRFDF